MNPGIKLILVSLCFETWDYLYCVVFQVKFRHEVYPDNTKEASRQILLVSDIEIRDRLATSQINKFRNIYIQME